MAHDRITMDSVALAALELTCNILLKMRQKKMISSEDCEEIFECSIDQQLGAASDANLKAAAVLAEMQMSFRKLPDDA